MDYLPNVTTVVENTDQEVIIITHDKLMLALNKYDESNKKSKDWIAPIGIILTILVVLVTSNFNDAFSLSKDTWKALFIFALVLSFVWLICTLKNLATKMNIEDLMKIIKTSVQKKDPP